MRKTRVALAATLCVWLIQPTQIHNHTFSKRDFEATHPHHPLYGKRVITQPVQSRFIVAEHGKRIELPPILQKIGWCESSGWHYLKDGRVLRGKRDPHDTGLFQINTEFHEARARELGYDLGTIAGNAEFAKYLLRTKGTKPWSASKPCWKKKLPHRQPPSSR